MSVTVQLSSEASTTILNHFGVGYIFFGSHVARLNGLPLETVDVDVVPAPSLTT